MEAVLYDVSQKVVFLQENSIQFFFCLAQLFLQLRVVCGKNMISYQCKILRFHFFLKVFGSRYNSLLQCFVRSIVLCSVNQTVVLHTELLRHFYHLFAKTLHFLFVCSQLVGIELIEMFINQAHIMLQYLFQWLEIEQSRQELVEISPLQ